MDNIDYFDVLIVYSSFAAVSASKNMADSHTPFSQNASNANYNISYAYFLEACKAQGLTAAFSTSDDIIDSGTCSSYWLYEDSNWKRVVRSCRSNEIFDKLSPASASARDMRKKLFSSDDVRPFNNEYLSLLFTDKLETYEKLPKFSIPTVHASDKRIQGIEGHLKELKNLVSAHKYSADFTHEVILKNRNGAGGNHIYKFDKDIADQIYEKVCLESNFSFIIQPYLEFQNGFSYEGKATATDIRLIYQNEKLIQTYIRMAKSGDFRCNEHRGGKLVYVEFDDIPSKVRKVGREIVDGLKQERSLFALDFIVSDNGNVFFLEGNSGPGIDWNLKLKKNELKSKELIRNIVKEFVSRVSEAKEQVSDQNSPEQAVFLESA